MSEIKQKFMIIDGESGASEAIQEILAQHYDVTIVGTAKEAAEKAENQDFDLIVTGYILPQISGAKAISEIKTTKDIAPEEKAKLLKKLREAVKQVEMDFQAKKSATEVLLRESQAKQDKILDLLNDRMRQLENENTELGREVRSFKEQLSTAVKQRADAEEKAEAARNDVAHAERELETLLAEKAEAEKQAETALLEKTEIEKTAGAAIKERDEAEKKVDDALHERAEMEKKLAGATRNIEALNKQTTSLKEELDKTITIAETAVNEKTRLQEKLAKIQENWEKYIADK